MWQYLNATKLLSGEIAWHLCEGDPPGTLSDDDGLEIRLHNFPDITAPAQSPRKIRDSFNRTFEANNIDWIRAEQADWRIDLGKLVQFEPALATRPWLNGKVSISPRYEPPEETTSGHVNEASLSFVFTKDSVSDLSSADVQEEDRLVVFYSWQSDLPNSTNRGFIEGCLRNAIKNLQKDDDVKIVALDRDTQGERGSPDISDTIFRKIDNCIVFVGDVSIINKPLHFWQRIACMIFRRRLTPNPNVMLELGYAAKTLNWTNVLNIANTFYGRQEELPFDLRKRVILGYSLAPGQEKFEARKRLVKLLEEELRKCLNTVSQDQIASIEVSFGQVDNHQPIGNQLSITASLLTGVDHRKLPDYEIAHANLPPSMRHIQRVVQQATSNLEANPDYLREKAYYIWSKALLRPVVFGVHNTGPTPLTGVHLKIEIPKNMRIHVMEELPECPWKERSRFDMGARLRDMARNYQFGNELVQNRQDRFIISVPYGKVQADDWSWSEPIYIGSEISQTFELAGRVFNDQGQPLAATFTIKVELTEQEWSLDMIKKPLKEEMQDET